VLQEWRTAFNELQQDRRKLMIRLNGLTPSQLEFQPSPSEWSLLQVMEHLALSEQALLVGAQKKLSQPARPVTIRENFGALAVLSVMKLPIKVKTPSNARQVIPQKNPPFDAVRSQWSATRDEFERFLEELPAERRTSALFRHPVSGGMTPGQALRFIRAHIHHHSRQIDRLIRQAPAAVTVASQ
jgi:uncharacterized damage-inducible protein DinB